MLDISVVWLIVLIGLIKQDECNLASDTGEGTSLHTNLHTDITKSEPRCHLQGTCPCYQRNFKIKCHYHLNTLFFQPRLYIFVKCISDLCKYETI